MNNQKSQTIVTRFFSAIEKLKEQNVINGTQTFTRRYNINRWNFMTCRDNPQSDVFQVEWLERLSRDFHVNLRWLVLGEGDFFDAGWTAELVKKNLPEASAAEG